MYKSGIIMGVFLMLGLLGFLNGNSIMTWVNLASFGIVLALDNE
jgi:hypothetical protein